MTGILRKLSSISTLGPRPRTVRDVVQNADFMTVRVVVVRVVVVRVVAVGAVAVVGPIVLSITI